MKITWEGGCLTESLHNHYITPIVPCSFHFSILPKLTLFHPVVSQYEAPFPPLETIHSRILRAGRNIGLSGSAHTVRLSGFTETTLAVEMISNLMLRSCWGSLEQKYLKNGGRILGKDSGSCSIAPVVGHAVSWSLWTCTLQEVVGSKGSEGFSCFWEACPKAPCRYCLLGLGPNVGIIYKLRTPPLGICSTTSCM